jgi:excisionase family DNA binding protein
MSRLPFSNPRAVLDKQTCASHCLCRDDNCSPREPRADFAFGSGSLKTREWLTSEQAADYLGLSVGALRNMTSNGQVPYHKLGRRNRYLRVELRQLLLSQKRGARNGN